jgi:hypothetical protein
VSTVTAGNPVTLTAAFALAGQPSPDDVQFTVEAPDSSTTVYPSSSPKVTHSGDTWQLALGVPGEVGIYRWQAVGYTGSTVSETIPGTFDVQPSVVDPEAPTPPGPSLGPCGMWITGDDVARCVNFDYGSSPVIFDTVAYEASMALYEISGRQFPGLCKFDNPPVRPTRDDCDCWPISYGMGPWYWISTPWGYGAGSWMWRNERGDTLGCQPMSRVNLAGYPVREILEVKIGGVVLPEFDPDSGFRNWRLDEWRWLTRMDTPTTDPGVVNPIENFWPGCQDMSLDDDQPGTFSVSYSWGVDPPELGRAAAVEIAEQLWLACGGSNLCKLPAGAVRVERQGIVVERGLLANWADPSKAVGLVSTDLFLQAYCRGQRSARRGAVWSPDVQGFARRLGTPS